MTYIRLPPPNWARQFLLDNALKLEMGIPVKYIYEYLISGKDLIIITGDNNGMIWPWQKVLDGDFHIEGV